MAACGSVQHIFDNLLPENPTLLESLAWNQIKSVKSLEQQPSFTEIFGELHFKESPISSPSPSSSQVSTSSSSSSSSPTETNHTKLNQNEDPGWSSSSDTNQTPSSSGSASSIPVTNHISRHKSSDSFSSLSSESLQLCTEGLGFESSYDVEDLKSGMTGYCWQSDQREKVFVQKHVASEEDYSYGVGEWRRSRVRGRGYPPPISCIGRSGKAGVCFRSFRSNGRFVLKEIRIPSQEFLHAYREDGRLKLHFIQPEYEFLEEEEEEEDDDDDDDDDDDEGEKEEEEEGVRVIEEEEENMRKENDGCVKDHVNEE